MGDPDLYGKWGLPIGRKKIALAAYAKALRFVANDEVRIRLQEERQTKIAWAIVIRIVLSMPAYSLNLMFSLAARILNRQSTPVVLYDLRRRRRTKQVEMLIK